MVSWPFFSDTPNFIHRQGRIKQRLARAALHYAITVATDPRGPGRHRHHPGQTHLARQRGGASERVLPAQPLGRAMAACRWPVTSVPSSSRHQPISSLQPVMP